MRRLTAILMMNLLAGISTTAAVADSFSIYSDVCYNVEGGDILGQRIGIIWLADAPYVFLQAAEGDWAAPMVGKASADDLKRGKLVFAVSDGGKPLSFRGTITEKLINGQFEGWFGDKGKPLAVNLKRVPVSQKGTANCR